MKRLLGTVLVTLLTMNQALLAQDLERVAEVAIGSNLSQDVIAIYSSPAGADTWTKNGILVGDRIYSGTTAVVLVPGGWEICKFDFKFVVEDENSLVETSQNVCDAGGFLIESNVEMISGEEAKARMKDIGYTPKS